MTSAQNPDHPERIEHIYQFVIPAKQRPERLDAFITHSIIHATRSRVQKAIERGSVTVNDAPSRSNYKVKPGDVIRVTVMKPPPLQLIPQDLPVDVVYDDPYLMVLVKPAGMSTHPGFGNRSGTLVNAMLFKMGVKDPIDVLGRRESWGDDEEEDSDTSDKSDQADADTEDDELSFDESQLFSSSEVRPGIVHRLDKDTSGLIVVGKTYQATLALANQFRDRTVRREYHALVWGVVKEDRGLIETEIGRNPRNRKTYSVVDRGGKYAATEYTVLERYSCTTLVKCKLRTGRTHQIRVHMSSLKHPIVGDADYGGRESALNGVHHLYKRTAQRILACMSRQALHARTLGFTHPITRQALDFEAEPPEDMRTAIDICRQDAQS